MVDCLHNVCIDDDFVGTHKRRGDLHLYRFTRNTESGDFILEESDRYDKNKYEQYQFLSKQNPRHIKMIGKSGFDILYFTEKKHFGSIMFRADRPGLLLCQVYMKVQNVDYSISWCHSGYITYAKKHYPDRGSQPSEYDRLFMQVHDHYSTVPWEDREILHKDFSRFFSTLRTVRKGSLSRGVYKSIHKKFKLTLPTDSNLKLLYDRVDKARPDEEGDVIAVFSSANNLHSLLKRNHFAHTIIWSSSAIERSDLNPVPAFFDEVPTSSNDHLYLISHYNKHSKADPDIQVYIDEIFGVREEISPRQLEKLEKNHNLLKANLKAM